MDRMRLLTQETRNHAKNSAARSQAPGGHLIGRKQL